MVIAGYTESNESKYIIEKIHHNNQQCMHTVLSFASDSAIGGRNENQDYHGNSYTPHGFLAVVCDGVGGNVGGFDAARMGVNAIIGYCQGKKTGNPIQILKEAALYANNAILNYADENPSFKGMASTFVAVLISENSAYVCHAGDSRLYQYRNGVQIYRTNDHSHVFELLRRGIIQNERQAKEHPRANEIMRALGLTYDLEVECHQFDFQPGDILLLCTDGINEALDDFIIAAEIKKGNNPDDIVNNLIVMADNIGHQRGGEHDNITVQIIKIHKEPKPREALNEPQVVLKKKSSNLPLIILFGLLTIVVSLSVWLLIRYYYRPDSLNKPELELNEPASTVLKNNDGGITPENETQNSSVNETDSKVEVSNGKSKSLFRSILSMPSLKPVRSSYELKIEERDKEITKLKTSLDQKYYQIDSLKQILKQLTDTLKTVSESNQKTQPPPENSVTKINRTPSSIDSIRQIQTWLNELGYNCGKIDGAMGNRTREEMNKFRKDKGLPETRNLNSATYKAIREAHSELRIQQNDSIQFNNNGQMEDQPTSKYEEPEIDQLTYHTIKKIEHYEGCQ